MKSLAGFKDTQDALLLGGDFNKLYVSSLVGHVRVFQGESWPVQDFKVEPDPNRRFYDALTNLIYFGYGGQNAGFDAYGRMGKLQPKRGAGDDQLVADMIAPTPRPATSPKSPWTTTFFFLFATPVRTDSISSIPGSVNSSRTGPPAVTAPQTWRSTVLAPFVRRHKDSSGNDRVRQRVGQEIQDLPGPETMDGVHYDANLKRLWVTGVLVRPNSRFVDSQIVGPFYQARQIAVIVSYQIARVYSSNSLSSVASVGLPNSMR
jgi:hypothetical protein